MALIKPGGISLGEVLADRRRMPELRDALRGELAKLIAGWTALHMAGAGLPEFKRIAQAMHVIRALVEALEPSANIPEAARDRLLDDLEAVARRWLRKQGLPTNTLRPEAAAALGRHVRETWIRRRALAPKAQRAIAGEIVRWLTEQLQNRGDAYGELVQELPGDFASEERLAEAEDKVVAVLRDPPADASDAARKVIKEALRGLGYSKDLARSLFAAPGADF
ncbi:hypothetical protein Rctr16k_13 [Virus Rctr16k]|nr:hypothetical protein Rctr16k_13 [Virus Rctr16k]